MRVTIKCDDGNYRTFEHEVDHKLWIKHYRAELFRR